MADSPDTLNIGSIRLRREYREAQELLRHAERDGSVNPAAAAAARARLAEIHAGPHRPEFAAGAPDTIAPASPTADLVTDKHALAEAERAEKTPLVRGRKFPSFVTPLLTAIGVFLLVLVLFKAPVMITQLQYAFSGQPKTPVAAAVPTEVVPAENTISIPKINVKAPVLYEPSIQEAAIQRALQDGVVHYGNTAVPGQSGNVAIFGHSSNDWWEPGNYKFVFVLLDKLAVGDRVTVDYQSKRYVYEVTGSKVVEPTDVSVLNPTTTPTLSIITCSPPGTSLKRLVVTAKQISPDPSQTTVAVKSQAPATETADSLAGSKPSFLEQLAQGWKDLIAGGKSTATPTPAPGQLPTAK